MDNNLPQYLAENGPNEDHCQAYLASNCQRIMKIKTPTKKLHPMFLDDRLMHYILYDVYMNLYIGQH